MDTSLHNAGKIVVLYFLFFGVPTILLAGTAIWIWALKKIWQEREWSDARRGTVFGAVLCSWLLGALIYATYKKRKGIAIFAVLCFGGLAFAALATEPWQSWLDKRIVVSIQNTDGAHLGNVYFKPVGTSTEVTVLYACKEGEAGFVADLRDGNCATPGDIRYSLKEISACSISNRFEELTRTASVPLPLKVLRQSHFVVAIVDTDQSLIACGSLDDAYDL